MFEVTLKISWVRFLCENGLLFMNKIYYASLMRSLHVASHTYSIRFPESKRKDNELVSEWTENISACNTAQQCGFIILINEMFSHFTHKENSHG